MRGHSIAEPIRLWHVPLVHCCAVSTADPTDLIDRWLRQQPPRVELALRYSIRGKFRNMDSRAFNARVDELFAAISPDEDEYAAILRLAREIGRAMVRHVAEG